MLTRKRFILMLMLFLLLALLMMTPLILVFIFKPVEGEESPLEMIPLFVGIVALTGGFMAGTNNGLQKADISSGWKRYSFVLPPTAKQQAISDLFVKLCYILFFGLLSAGFAWIFTAATDYNAFGIMLNIYLGAVCAVMLVDIAYSYIVMLANDKNQFKVIGVIAFFGAGIVLRVFDLFPGMNKTENPAEGGALLSDEQFNRLMTALTSHKTTLCFFGVFAVLCAVYFFVLWRSHERREP